ncbi:MAG: CBS domain-containing protein [Anaerolineae bacterium]|nr:CBS domain-containing protein [Anaerolineae bacterium]
MQEKTVAEVMHKGVIACRPDTPMNEVVRIVSDTDVHAIVVMDENSHALGVVSHVDIIRLFDKDLAAYTASDVMSHTIYDIELHESARAAVDKILANGVHRLLVVETDGNVHRPVGIISTTDLIKEMRGSRWVWYMG